MLCNPAARPSGVKTPGFARLFGTAEQRVEKSGRGFLQGLKPIVLDGFTPQLKHRPPNRLRKNLEFVIPNGVCEVRNLSFLDILIEEGFLASLGMTAKRIFQQPAKDKSFPRRQCPSLRSR